MKLFHLYRREDQTGVSGTGPVVEGVEFTNGWCAIRWMSEKSTLCFYQTMTDVRAIHGHGDRTELIVHDFDPLQKSRLSVGQTELFLQTIEEISEVMNLVEERDTTRDDLHRSFDRIRGMLGDLELRLSTRLRKVS